MSAGVSVFVDESGDLGSSPRSSRHLVAAALATADPVAVRRLVRKAHRRFGPKTKRLGELKYNSASPRLRSYVLAGVASSDAHVAWSAFFKPGLPSVRTMDMGVMLNLLYIRTVVALVGRSRARSVSLVVDKRKLKEKAREEFERDLQEAICQHHSGFFPPEVRVLHLDSQNSEGLQVADFVTGAVYKCLERGDSSDLDVIGRKVVFGRLSW